MSIISTYSRVLAFQTYQKNDTFRKLISNMQYLMEKRVMIPATLTRIRQFTIDRDWEQFHTPANLAKSISIEAAELL